MSTELIGILGVAATILGSLLTFFLTSKRNNAEVEKLQAEAERARVETEKIRQGMLPSQPQPAAPASLPSCEVSALTAERSHLSPYYIEQIEATASLEIISLTLHSALENFGKEKFVQWIQAGKRLRILMLAPDSIATTLRSRQESPDEHFLSAKIIESLVRLKNLQTYAEKQLRGQEYSGSLEVRLFDDLPYFSYFHTDKALVLGLYYGHLAGLQSDALLIDEKSSLHPKLRDHFAYLWNKSGKRGTQNTILCTISKGRNRFNDALLESFRHPVQ